MLAILLPVKVFAQSKKRLADFLSPDERTLLARTMFEDVWNTLRETRALERDLRLLVTTAEPYVMDCCRRECIECMEEPKQISHSDSVNGATRWAVESGVSSLLSIPIDAPGITAVEILNLFEIGRKFAVVIAPSSDGLGTNALLRTPPDAIRPHFGPGSCRLHSQEAERNGYIYTVSPSPGFGNDIDTPDDLRSFCAMDKPCRTLDLIRQLLAIQRVLARS